MDPYDDVDEFEKTMKRLLEGFFGKGSFSFFGPTSFGARMGAPSRAPGVREPLTDICETRNEVIITMELPGARKEDIDLDVSAKGIEISARTEKISESDTSSRKAFTKFSKFMSLPAEVDPDSVEAKYHNGILEIKLSKLDKTPSKKVKIR